jgi:hypothetical protein
MFVSPNNHGLDSPNLGVRSFTELITIGCRILTTTIWM